MAHSIASTKGKKNTEVRIAPMDMTSTIVDAINQSKVIPSVVTPSHQIVRDMEQAIIKAGKSDGSGEFVLSRQQLTDLVTDTINADRKIGEIRSDSHIIKGIVAALAGSSREAQVG